MTSLSNVTVTKSLALDIVAVTEVAPVRVTPLAKFAAVSATAPATVPPAPPSVAADNILP